MEWPRLGWQVHALWPRGECGAFKVRIELQAQVDLKGVCPVGSHLSLEAKAWRGEG